MNIWRRLLMGFTIAIIITVINFAAEIIAVKIEHEAQKDIRVPLDIAPVVALVEKPEPIDPCFLEAVVCPGEEFRAITAYTSEASQTDGTPCIAASGDNICELWQEGMAICAANFVDFGTQLYVEGLGICTVLDRMNERYPQGVDWYFGYDTAGARAFGRDALNVMILGDK